MGNGRWMVGVLAVSALLLGGDLSGGTAADAGSQPAIPQACGWQVVLGANVPGENNTLYSMAVIAANDIWAVGAHNAPQSTSASLIEHWNGSAWSIVPSPPVSGTAAVLQGVSGVTSTDVWAVGNYQESAGPVRGLILHWDGTTWAVVPSTTNPGTVLRAVAVVAATDVWAMGWTDPGPGLPVSSTALHWDGRAWTGVALPNWPDSDNYVAGLTAVGPNDIWAVGQHSTGNRLYDTLILHWNGTAWSIVSSPNPGSGENYLDAVTAVAANDVWAVGVFVNASEIAQALALHWNGSSWQNVFNGGGAVLRGAVARAANDVWAVGYSGSVPIVHHWDGQSWQPVEAPPMAGAGGLTAVQVVDGEIWTVGAVSNGALTTVFTARLAEGLCTATPTPTLTATPSCTPGWQQYPSPNGAASNRLEGIAVRAANDGWAVGQFSVNSQEQTLILHWDGVTWRMVPSPSVAGENNYLQRVVAPAADDAWAVGYTTSQLLLLHWNGTAWSRAPGPVLDVAYSKLYGLAATGPQDVWALGSVAPTPSSGFESLILHWDGTTWQQVGPTYPAGGLYGGPRARPPMPGRWALATGAR